MPLDLLEFFCLTPLPGSEDHQKLLKAGIPMDPDMNKYDLEHVTTGHPKMSKAEWEGVYRQAWETYYTPEHMETIMRRAYATGISPGKMMFLLIWFYGCVTIEKIHPLEGGYLRRKVRRDRRPGLPIENPLRLLSEIRRRARRQACQDRRHRLAHEPHAARHQARPEGAPLPRPRADAGCGRAISRRSRCSSRTQSSRAAAAKAKLRAAAAA